MKRCTLHTCFIRGFIRRLILRAIVHKKENHGSIVVGESRKFTSSFLTYPYDATKATLCSSYLNTLLVFLPIGIAGGDLGYAVVTVFFLNFLAIIPLAHLIAFSTGELSTGV